MIRLLIPAIDSFALICSFFLSYIVRDVFFDSPVQPISFYVSFIFASVVILLFSFNAFHIYNDRSPLSLSSLVAFLKAVVFWAATLIVLSFFLKTDYSRIILLLFIVVTPTVLFMLRVVFSFFSSTAYQRQPDEEIYSMREKIVQVAALSADQLLLLEGVRQAQAPSGVYLFLKRLADIIFSIFSISFLIPFLPVIAFLIIADSKGPVFVAQQRVGKEGRLFTMYKFRTMRSDVLLYERAPISGDDNRVTRIGRWLRRYSIDELPQFLNVLVGNMSIVGPRPEMPFIVKTYSEWQRMRLLVKPGITGIWQILGRKDIPLSENIEYDLYYVFYQSFFLDVAIILRTIPHLIFPKGAY